LFINRCCCLFVAQKIAILNSSCAFVAQQNS
jgi:hypothetical protein